MSEYQYYEFRAVDRLLSQDQMDELRNCSSRAEIAADRFVNYYNWGDLKGDPDAWMEEYFDAFLYFANWGTHILKLRVPINLLNPHTAEKYCTGDSFSCRTAGDYLILSFDSVEEDYDWEDNEGELATIIQLRIDLMNGDYRSLYLGWLLSVMQDGLGDDTLEPPVPPGLNELNTPLLSLIDFLRIDEDLVAAAAEKSSVESVTGPSSKDLSDWLVRLPMEEKNALLLRLLEGSDSHVVAEFKQRALCEIREQAKAGNDVRPPDPRTVGELLGRFEMIEDERLHHEEEERVRQEARRKQAEPRERRKHLESLMGREGLLWVEVDEHIAAKHAARYDQAVTLLKDLRDLYEINDNGSEFKERMSSLYREHSRKWALLDRLRRAKLLE